MTTHKDLLDLREIVRDHVAYNVERLAEEGLCITNSKELQINDLHITLNHILCVLTETLIRDKEQ